MSFWAKPWNERLDAFQHLRDHDPVCWQEPPEALAPGLDNNKGYWAITRADDIRELSRNTDVFSSAEGVFVDDFPALEAILSFLVMDAPRHGQLRGIVASAFTPKHIRKMEEQIKAEAAAIVNEIVHLGEADLCEVMFKQLPGRIFADFVGVHDHDTREILIEGAEQLGSWLDPKYAHVGPPLMVFVDAAQKIMAVSSAEAEKRRKEPGDDLITWIVEAEAEGQRMTEEEISAFFCLLVGAANDTTRHAMAHSVITLQDHPDQLTYLLEDFEARIEQAVEELLRWQPPLMHFRRTATADFVLHDKTIKAGDKCVLWYVSGNYDERAFPDANRFDITRTPNRHLAFGAGGPHYCMGAALGRQVMRCALREIYTRMPDIRVGEPDLLLSNFMNGVKSLPARWTPPAS
jgi:cytochrome P450